MKKFVVLLMALCLILAIGATASFADYTKDGVTAGYVGCKGLSAQLDGTFAHVNPFAYITFGTINKAVLSGDGGLAGGLGSDYADGSVPVNLYCNTALKMSATVKNGYFEWIHDTDGQGNHPNGTDNWKYKVLPVDVAWNGDALVKGADVYQGNGNQQNVDTTATSSKLYDAWTYENEIIKFRVHAPKDSPDGHFIPLSIDELHAGDYKGTIIVTVTAAPVGFNGNKEAASSILTSACVNESKYAD